MVIHFTKTVQDALKTISFTSYHEFLIHHEESATEHSQELISKYGDAKWAIVDLLNKKFSQNSDLINWLHHNQEDELSYFLNEVGSNVLNYSEFKAPYKFHLWVGSHGFVVGVEQKGTSFNAELIERECMKDNEGAAFDFFRKCKSSIFFDDARSARIVYFEHKF